MDNSTFNSCGNSSRRVARRNRPTAEGRLPAVGCPLESNGAFNSFATVRHCTVRSKGCLSNKTALAIMFMLAKAAEKIGVASIATTSWRKYILGRAPAKIAHSRAHRR